MQEKQKEFDSQQINQRFNRDAGVFEAIYNEEEKGFSKWFNQKFRKPVYERYATALNVIGNATGKRIIDIGCGTGIYMVALADQGASKVLGVDLSEQMLKFTSNKIQAKNLTQTCELIHGNFLNLEFKETFDYSLAMGVFDYLPDPVTFMRKLKTVTTGKIIASFPAPSLIRGTLRKLRYLLTSRGSVYFYTKEDIKKIVEKVGFNNYQLRPMETGSGFILIAMP